MHEDVVPVDWTVLAAFGQHLIRPLAVKYRLSHADAADCVSEALLAAWEHRDELYAPATGWLSKAAGRKAIDLHRRSWRRRVTLFTSYGRRDEHDEDEPREWADASINVEESVVDDLERAALAEAVNSVLAELPPKVAHLLRNAYASGTGPALLARHQGVPIGTMASRTRRARHQFLQLWRARFGTFLEVSHAPDDH